MGSPVDDQRKAWRRTFGNAIRTARIDRAMTQAELGRALGLTRASIANIEAGRQEVHASRAAHLVALLGVEVPGWSMPADHWREAVDHQRGLLRDLHRRLQLVRDAVDAATAPPLLPAESPEAGDHA